MRKIVIVILFALFCYSVNISFAQARKFTFAGEISDKSTAKPVEFATVLILSTSQWAVADADGKFTINNVPGGKLTVRVECLGYASYSKEIVINKNVLNYKVQLLADNLALESAVVTAKENSNSATSSRIIDKTALEHIQLMNVADISSLLPGGTTTNNDLTREKKFNIRSENGEKGNASFGIAVEVDGARLSNNASYSDVGNSSLNAKSGIVMNNIASTNVESVEVVSGVPSVEYGDMSSGLVKINTKKGKTPFIITLSTSPKTKQTSISKGFSLGSSRRGVQRGVVNSNLEYTESFRDAMSPYTAYKRQQLSLSYMNLFNRGIFDKTPLSLNAGITGNIGGMDSSADPDAVKGTWSKARDNALRANFSLKWLLSKAWITNLELLGSLSYSDKSSFKNEHYSSAVNKIVLHGRKAGYYMAEAYKEGEDRAVTYIPHGYWYNEMRDEDLPLSTKLSLKANLAHNFGMANNSLKFGSDWTADMNFGIGAYSPDMSTAPTFREYRYCDIPVMHNIGIYLEDNLMIPLGSGRINLIAGLRNDNTSVKGSAYGLSSSLSPRFNAKYTILSPKGRRGRTLRELSLRASWGMAVKLPSFSILFPIPTYRDIPVFTSTTNSSNESFSAYNITPRTVEYNPALRKQRNSLGEIGAEADILGNRISLVAFMNRTLDTYMINNDYDRISYTYTSAEALQGIAIPADDRAFSIDRTTGTVTVSDKTGKLPPVALANSTWRELSPRYYADNIKSPIDRYGLEWVVDFAPIKPIYTSVRIDGTWYVYKMLNTDIRAYSPYSQRSAIDGMPYGYIGYFYGGNGTSNGSKTRTLRTNVTLTTHIPRVRIIISAKIEASLLKYSRLLSERRDGTEVAKVISERNDILSTTGKSIYDGDNYAVVYPLTYSTYDDPEPKDYLSALKAARESGNTKLFNDLSQLSSMTSFLYNFAEDYISPYFNANFSVTKEIGDLASISFYANNFFNNKSQVWSTRTRQNYSSENYIPSFYYGLTLRMKF